MKEDIGNLAKRLPALNQDHLSIFSGKAAQPRTVRSELRRIDFDLLRLMGGLVEHITPFAPSSASERIHEVLPFSPVVCHLRRIDTVIGQQ